MEELNEKSIYNLYHSNYCFKYNKYASKCSFYTI